MGKPDFYEFLKAINAAEELSELYSKALPVIMSLCNADKMLFFRYNSKKRCFDLKAGLRHEDLNAVYNDSFLENDVSFVLENEFSLRAREFGSSCNDAIRSFVESQVEKNAKTVKKDSVQPSRFRKIFDEFDLGEEILYLPLIARGRVVGFLLFSPVCVFDGIEDYIEAFSCCLDKLLLKKRLTNIESVISSYKPSERDDKIYELGKTALAVAHEMKNSLIGVIGLFNKLALYIQEDEKALKYKNIIKTQLEKLYNFVLDINRISKVSQSNVRENVDLAEIIDNSIEMASTFSDNVSFSVSIGKGAEWLRGNKDQLEQVFLNLFKNSIEANKEGKVKINVAANKKGDYLVIKIRDNSGGVDERTLKSMIKPFYTTKTNGTGLGLAIVKGIIESYNGSIEFRNIPGGLECIIKLPVKEMEDKNGQENYGS